MNFINVMCVLTAPHTGRSPTLPLSSGLPGPWDTTVLEFGQLEKPAVVAKWCPVKEEPRLSLYVKAGSERGEEGMWKAREADSLASDPRQGAWPWMQRKSSRRK